MILLISATFVKLEEPNSFVISQHLLFSRSFWIVEKADFFNHIQFFFKKIITKFPMFSLIFPWYSILQHASLVKNQHKQQVWSQKHQSVPPKNFIGTVRQKNFIEKWWYHMHQVFKYQKHSEAPDGATHESFSALWDRKKFRRFFLGYRQ